MTSVASVTEPVVANVETVIVGKRQQIELLLVAILCQGHVLIQDVPGTGKTMLARRLPTILPAMALDEALETTKIHSVAGLMKGAVKVLEATHLR